MIGSLRRSINVLVCILLITTTFVVAVKLSTEVKMAVNDFDELGADPVARTEEKSIEQEMVGGMIENSPSTPEPEAAAMCDDSLEDEVRDSAIEALNDLRDAINSLDDSVFKNNPNQRRKALANKINAMINMVTDGKYNEAQNKLRNDIFAKMDGYLGGHPNNDWIIDENAQKYLKGFFDTYSGAFAPITIYLKSRTFVPDPGIDADLELPPMPSNIHVIAQLYCNPTDTERSTLSSMDIELLDYVHNRAWFASLSSDKVNEFGDLQFVRAITPILPADRVAPHFVDEEIAGWAENPNGTVNLLVVFFDDVEPDDARQSITLHGWILEEPIYSTVWTAVVPEDQIMNLAEDDDVQWIEEVPPPNALFNDGSRAAINVDAINAALYNLLGAGIAIAEWDGGWVDNAHNDFTGRITIGDFATCNPNAPDFEICAVQNHPTHVGGTAAGDGTNSGGSFAGMASAANLISYEWPNSINEMNTETTDAFTNHNAIISQNSWGFRVEQAWDPNSCNLLGYYHTWSREYDEMVQGDLGQRVTVVFAAGNERNDGDCGIPGRGGYDSIPAPGGTAKNTIVVGATNSNDDSMTGFSSWGPTDDGRLKPDVMAAGCQVGGDNGITSTMPGEGYASGCGTSMATPAVSGTIALLQEVYQDTHGGANPWPSTAKAVLIASAVDLGNVGPDYSFGWGLVDAQEAADLILEDPVFDNIVEDNIVDTGTNDITRLLSAGADLIVTLAWDDEEGTPNDGLQELVNDLDLEVIDPSGTIHYPWILNPTNPANVATKGNAATSDTLNNIESVFVDAVDVLAGVWTFRILGTDIPMGNQDFSLVINGELIGIPEPPTDLMIEVSPLDSDDIILSWTLSVSANIDHYNIYRSTTVDGFDFSSPYTTVSSLTTTYTDTDVNEIGNAKYQVRYYYTMRAVDTAGRLSTTTYTVGKYTKEFDTGYDEFSLPLEPFVTHSVDWYVDEIGCWGINYFSYVYQVWQWHKATMPPGVYDPDVVIGETYQCSGPTGPYTFVGRPGASIRYLDTGLVNPTAFMLSVSGNDIVLSWDPVAGSDHYNVYRAVTRNGFDFTAPIHSTLAGNPAQTSWTDTNGVTSAKEYYYMVMSVDAAGNEGSSTYSVGKWTKDFISGNNTFGLPLEPDTINSVDWYCDAIPNTFQIKWILAGYWVTHLKSHNAGEYDTDVLLSDGYEINVSAASSYTFIGM